MTLFQDSAKAHLKRLDSLIDRGSVPRLRKLYTQSADELENMLAKAIGNGAAPFTIRQHQLALAQCKQALVKLSIEMGGKLGKETAAIQNVSAQALIKDIRKLNKKYGDIDFQLPIEQASKFAGVVDKRRSSLLKLNKTSMAKYGGGVVASLEQVLARGMIQGKTGYALIGDVRKAQEMEWWKAERIIRTENAWAYNATQMDATTDAAKSFPDLMMRWVEYVADVTLAKLDTRVGDDSVAMHGQLARPGANFVMPASAPVPVKITPSLVGKVWTQPPNRPNDRAVLQPWRPGWGWGWELINGARVPR